MRRTPHGRRTLGGTTSVHQSTDPQRLSQRQCPLEIIRISFQTIYALAMRSGLLCERSARMTFSPTLGRCSQMSPPRTAARVGALDRDYDRYSGNVNDDVAPLVHPTTLRALVEVESGGNPFAVSINHPQALRKAGIEPPRSANPHCA